MKASFTTCTTRWLVGILILACCWYEIATPASVQMGKKETERRLKAYRDRVAAEKKARDDYDAEVQRHLARIREERAQAASTQAVATQAQPVTPSTSSGSTPATRASSRSTTTTRKPSGSFDREDSPDRTSEVASATLTPAQAAEDLATQLEEAISNIFQPYVANKKSFNNEEHDATTQEEYQTTLNRLDTLNALLFGVYFVIQDIIAELTRPLLSEKVRRDLQTALVGQIQKLQNENAWLIEQLIQCVKQIAACKDDPEGAWGEKAGWLLLASTQDRINYLRTLPIATHKNLPQYAQQQPDLKFMGLTEEQVKSLNTNLQQYQEDFESIMPSTDQPKIITEKGSLPRKSSLSRNLPTDLPTPLVLGDLYDGGKKFADQIKQQLEWDTIQKFTHVLATAKGMDIRQPGTQEAPTEKTPTPAEAQKQIKDIKDALARLNQEFPDPKSLRLEKKRTLVDDAWSKFDRAKDIATQYPALKKNLGELLTIAREIQEKAGVEGTEKEEAEDEEEALTPLSQDEKVSAFVKIKQLQSDLAMLTGQKAATPTQQSDQGKQRKRILTDIQKMVQHIEESALTPDEEQQLQGMKGWLEQHQPHTPVSTSK